MFDHHTQTTRYEDLKALLEKVTVINDVFTFNNTMALGKQYAVWVDRHAALIDELEYMINNDLEMYEGS